MTNKLQSNINQLDFERLNQQLLELTKINQQQEKTINSGFTDIGIISDRIITTIEEKLTNNKQENQIKSNHNSIKQENNENLNNYNQQIKKLTDKFDKLI